MLNVSEATKQIYSEENVQKYLIISFPDDDIASITNDNIMSESMKLTQSICEDNVLKVGGCNASQFEVTVFDIPEDITNKNIIVTLSCKDPSFKGEYADGEKYDADDIVRRDGRYYQFYEQNSDKEFEECCDELYGYIDTSNVDDIVLFRGKVKSAKKQKDRRFKDILAYDRLHELSTTDITEWFNNASNGIVDHYFQGEWTPGTAYTKNQTVRLTVYPGTGAPQIHYYRCAKDMDNANYVYTNPLLLLGGQYGESGASYWTELSSSPEVKVTVKQLRDKVFNYLGITQDVATLPMDDYSLTIKPIDKILMATQLIQYLCNLNACFGQISSATGHFKYIIPTIPQVDSNYKGDFEIGVNYSKNNVVKVNNEDTYYSNKYFQCRMSTDAPTIVKERAEEWTTWIAWDDKLMWSNPTIVSNDAQNLWYLDIIYDEELAEAYGVIIKINTYTGGPSPYLTELEIVRNSGTRFKVLNSNFSTLNISVENAPDEFWKTFRVYRVFADGELANTYEPTDEIVAEFWENMPEIYHPSGMVNLSRMYELDAAEYQDYDYQNSGFNIIDDSNKILEGSTNDTAISINYSFLVNFSSIQRSFYNNVVSSLADFSVKYTPTSIKAVGLPFLECGDYYCYDIEETVNGENIIRTIKTLVLNRTISGIGALTDDMEAKYE